MPDSHEIDSGGTVPLDNAKTSTKVVPTALEPATFPTPTRTLMVNASFVVTSPEHDKNVREIIDDALMRLCVAATTFQHKTEFLK